MIITIIIYKFMMYNHKRCVLSFNVVIFEKCQVNSWCCVNLGSSTPKREKLSWDRPTSTNAHHRCFNFVRCDIYFGYMGHWHDM